MLCRAHNLLIQHPDPIENRSAHERAMKFGIIARRPDDGRGVFRQANLPDVMALLNADLVTITCNDQLAAQRVQIPLYGFAG